MAFVLSFPRHPGLASFRCPDPAAVIAAISEVAGKISATASASPVADLARQRRDSLTACVIAEAEWALADVLAGHLADATYRAPDGCTWRLMREPVAITPPSETGTARWRALADLEATPSAPAAIAGYCTTVAIEVLSSAPLPEHIAVEGVVREISVGELSMAVERWTSRPVDGPTLAALTLAQGSDPSFFGLDELGEACGD